MAGKAKNEDCPRTGQELRKIEQTRALLNLQLVKEREDKLIHQGRLRLAKVDKNTILLLRDDQTPYQWQMARDLTPEDLQRGRLARGQKTARETKSKLRTPEYVIQKEIARLRQEVQEVIQKINSKKEGYNTAQRMTLHNAVRSLRDLHCWTFPDIGKALGISKARATTYYKTRFVELTRYREAREQQRPPKTLDN